MDHSGRDIERWDGPPTTSAVDTARELLLTPAPRDDPLLTEIAWLSRRLPPDPFAPSPFTQAQAIAAGAPWGPQEGDDQPSRAPAPPPRPAAVLLAIAGTTAGELSIVLTRRAAHLAAHAGQIALPGGKVERGESAVDAALREAFEEVALPPSAVEILGASEPYLTRTGFLVVPVLGLVRAPARLVPDPQEVARVFTAPFRRVMTLDNHRKVEMMRNGRSRTIYEVMVGENRVWGVTASILRLVHKKLYAP